MDQSEGGDIVVSRGSVLSEVTELRDILPTFLDAAGLHILDSLNGTALFNLLKQYEQSASLKAERNNFQWREYINLEHDICYNVTNHWNALTNGHTKCIFRAFYNDEQLFAIESDLYNLASDKEYEDTLVRWRERLIKQFEAERRGPDWVKDGKLLRRVKGMRYSPNYPRGA